MERRRVGSIDVIALIDSIQTYPAGVVYPTAGDALARFSGYLDSDGGLALNFASFLVQDGQTTVLVDTGWGPEHDGRLMAELTDAGVSPDEIDIVTFTHLHGDHTGWNLDRTRAGRCFRVPVTSCRKSTGITTLPRRQCRTPSPGTSFRCRRPASSNSSKESIASRQP